MSGAHPPRRPDQEGRQQRRQRRDRDHDRVEKAAGHAEREPDAGDDERELADLAQRERRLHRRRDAVAGDEGADGDADQLPTTTTPVRSQHRPGVRPDEARIDQHPHRDEEDGGEEIAHRLDPVFDELAAPDSATSAPHRKAPNATE